VPYVFPILESIFLPPGLFLLLIVASLLLFLLRLRKSAYVVGLAGTVLLYLCSIQPFADLLITPLENDYPPFRPGQGTGAQYVVVLGGGIVPASPEADGRGTLAPESLKRLIYGARIAEQTGLPLIVSGGIVPSYPASESEAAIAKRTVTALGLPEQRILVEGKSRNTWENAVQVARRFHPQRAILVTSAYHMPRSVIAFNRNHINVIPAPTDYLSDRAGYTFYSFLPGASPLRVSAIALKEYLGYLYYRLFLFTTRHSS